VTKRQVKFHLTLPSDDFSAARTFAQRAEDLGFYAVSANDHLFLRGSLWDARRPQLECFTTLGALAALTSKVRLVHLVASMSFRNPALLAKMISTLDHISAGRIVAGVGAGWFREEYEAYGYQYPSNAERIERLADGIKLLKAMWTQDEPTYKGRFYSVERAFNFPKPVQKPHPPVLVGGSGRAVLKIVAEHGDIANMIPPILDGELRVSDRLKFQRAELTRRIQWLKEYAAAAGRAPDAIELSGYSRVVLGGDRSAVEREFRDTFGNTDMEFARRSMWVLLGTPDEMRRELQSRIDEFGITWFVLNIPTLEMVELFGREIIPAFA
jgi:probable F420-dependent oxidoreductase